jgi:protein-disulfide isomerase
MVEFADFQCPFCGKYFTEISPEIKKKYVDTGKVRFVYMNFAFLGEESMNAAEAARCALDQNKFWEYHDHLYKNQRGENIGAFSIENLKKFAVELGLNTQNFNRCLDRHKHKKYVENDVATAKAFGVSSTPSTFINDFMIKGLQGASYYSNRIDAALEENTPEKTNIFKPL